MPPILAPHAGVSSQADSHLEVAPQQPPPRPYRRSLAEIEADPRYTDRAKRIARYLDDRCRADWKWAAWPKVSTIASHLGWDATDHGGRKRVERGLKELIDGGDLGRLTLGDLVEWFDAEGQARGLDWPKELPRTFRLSLKVCVLNWRISPPSGKLPSLPECDSDVPVITAASASEPPHCRTDPDSTVARHPDSTVAPSPMERSNLSVGSEPKPFNVPTELARAGEGDGGTTTAKVDPVATGGHPPAAWTPREQAEKFFRRLRDRGLILKAEVDPERGEVIRTYPQTKYVEPIQPDEIAELVRLRPHVLAFLKGDKPTPPESSGVSQGRTARGIPNAVKDPVRSLIGQLAGNPEPAIEASVCRAISDALNDHNAESLGLFLGLAGDVRRGDLAEACLQKAFEAACGRSAKNRGSVFTSMVKRWKATHHPSGRTP